MPHSELIRFRAFLDERLAEPSELTPEEIVILWRDENPPIDESNDLVAVRAAVADFVAGDRGVPAQEVIASIRSQLGVVVEP